jgi:hypothetical protein
MSEKQKKVIIFWEFDDAPLEWQELSENSRDEDWIALASFYFGENMPSIVEKVSSGLFLVQQYVVDEGTIYIGAHA